MSSKRRKYTTEFKEEAVRLVTEKGYSIAEASVNLGINPNLLGKWKKALSGKALQGRSSEDLRSENKRLRRENARLVMEREILKKAAAFFAKESD